MTKRVKATTELIERAKKVLKRRKKKPISERDFLALVEKNLKGSSK